LAAGSVPSGPGLLSAIVAEATRLRRAAGRPAVAVHVDVAPWHEALLSADAGLARRALEPLVRRAFEAAATPDPLRDFAVPCEVTITSVDVGHAVEFEVADSGASLPEQVRAWLAQAGGEDRPVPERAGLALVAVREAVARLGGAIHAVNCPDGGAAITLRLPRTQARRLAA
jgi:signal transduction histidine kinase